MAKGQKKSNREVRKPKQEKTAAKPATFLNALKDAPGKAPGGKTSRG